MVKKYLTAFLKLSLLRFVYSSKKRLHSGFTHHLYSLHLAATNVVAARLVQYNETIKY